MNVPAKEAVNLMLAFAACGVVLNVYSAAISAFANPHANMLSSACKGSGDPVGNVLFCSMVPGEKLGGWLKSGLVNKP